MEQKGMAIAAVDMLVRAVAFEDAVALRAARTMVNQAADRAPESGVREAGGEHGT